MMRLYLSGLLRMARDRSELFWGLLFPVIMATLFFVSFGIGMDPEKMSAVPAGLVSEENGMFETFLTGMDEGILDLEKMDGEQALDALRAGKISGVFYGGSKPSLTVAASGIEESILQTLLSSYLEHETMMEQIAKEHPEKLFAAAAQLSGYPDLLEHVTATGRSMDTNLGYFYALIGMACLFGTFGGLDTSVEIRADQSALAVRRSVAPVHRLKLVLSGMLANFTLQFASVCLLLLYLNMLGLSFGDKWFLLLPVCALGSLTGVAFGIFVGSLKMRYGFKVGILVSSSLAMSFLAGLMFVNMKDIVEHHAPIINRVNPAALIADAFYSVAVYDNPARYAVNLALLAAITVLLTAVSFLRLRRERYESI